MAGVIVCLMGPSGAGKSTLAKCLQARQPDRFARVPVDFFFVPRPAGMSVAQHLAAPFSYDWDAVDRALASSGAQRSTPDCDFERMVRRSECGGLPISAAPIYLMDGMRPHPRCDFLVMLELDPIEQRRRLVNRDLRWGSHVADRESQLAATFELGCSELPRRLDLRLSATDPIETNAERIIASLAVVRCPNRCRVSNAAGMSEPGEPEPLMATDAEAAETAYWSRLYGRWEPLDLAGVAEFMTGFSRPWWVVGGWAIDAFTGIPRRHEDLDVSIFASDVPALRAHVRDRWHLWNLSGEDMRPLTDRHPDVFGSSSQVWVREHGDAPWVLDLPLTPDRDGLWTNKFIPDHVGSLDDVTWVADDQIRYLNPEIVLLFKARKRRTKDDRDFRLTWPLLAHDKQDWLQEMIRRTDDHHPWLA